MQFQAERATIRPDVMASMHFGNRLKPEYLAAQRKQIDIALDGETPIGFSFAMLSEISSDALNSKPPWADELSGTGFFPRDYQLPTTVGMVKLLYVDPNYRELHIGEALTVRSLRWMSQAPDVRDRWVYVANGNDAVGKFYERFGFVFSHSVFDGFINAYVLTPAA